MQQEISEMGHFSHLVSIKKYGVELERSKVNTNTREADTNRLEENNMLKKDQAEWIEKKKKEEFEELEYTIWDHLTQIKELEEEHTEYKKRITELEDLQKAGVDLGWRGRERESLTNSLG